MNDIDAYIYINLENRKDRKDLLLNEFKKVSIPENKIHKISGVSKPKNGHKGCVMSHILALELAKLNKWKMVAIFEDDMELNVSVNEYNRLLNKALQHDKWDMILLHGSYQEIKEPIDNDIYYLKHSTQSTGYIIKSNYYDTLLDLFKNCNNNMVDEKWGDMEHRMEPYALDQQWNKLIKKDNIIGFKTNLIKQRNITSSIN
jgi:GR25 family glycosyltransferase involved in LPS biosynthesis